MLWIIIMDNLSQDAFYYTLRLTPYPNTKEKVLYCRNKFVEFFETISSLNYLFSQEFGPNHHFHCVFSMNEYNGTDTKKDPWAVVVRDVLYKIFEVPKDKKGNTSYSLEEVRSIEEAFSYALKEGDYECTEEWETAVAEAFAKSYKKKHSLKSSLADLTDKFIKDEINDRDLWIGLGQSRADLGIPLSIRWIDEMLLSIQCKKDPTKLKDLWEDMEIKKQLKSM